MNAPQEHTRPKQKSECDVEPKADWRFVAINGLGIATANPSILDCEHAKSKRYRRAENQVERRGSVSIESAVTYKNCCDHEDNVSDHHLALGLAIHIAYR